MTHRMRLAVAAPPVLGLLALGVGAYLTPDNILALLATALLCGY